MKAAFYTLGCKVNQYETQSMIQQFSENGFEIVDFSAPADVYIINSCTVTAIGDKKSRQMIRRARRLSLDSVVVLCGCFPQAFPEEAKKISDADIILGSKNRADILDTVLFCMGRREKNPEEPLRYVDISEHSSEEKFEPLTVSGFVGRTRAFVKIQDGCERHCAYCIIPKARGPVRSRPLHEIADEIKSIAEAGYAEIVLVGINLSCYGMDIGHRLIDAVKVACNSPEIESVRLGSLEPELLSNEDIKMLAGFSKFYPSFHLSLQSGCDETLGRMRRHYTTAEYRRIVGKIRENFGKCEITTDIMVGFPGESEEEFNKSAAFVKEVGFANIHVFAYSPRPGTDAAAMDGQVSADEKNRRAEIMAKITGEKK